MERRKSNRLFPYRRIKKRMTTARIEKKRIWFMVIVFVDPSLIPSFLFFYESEQKENYSFEYTRKVKKFKEFNWRIENAKNSPVVPIARDLTGEFLPFRGEWDYFSFVFFLCFQEIFQLLVNRILENPACFIIDLRVGTGISVDPWNGTMTTLWSFRRTIWLPVCLFWTNHSHSRMDNIFPGFIGLSIL